MNMIYNLYWFDYIIIYLNKLLINLRIWQRAKYVLFFLYRVCTNLKKILLNVSPIVYKQQSNDK